MLRKILIATTAIAAMCVGSAALAMHGGSGGGHVGSLGGGGGGWHGGGGMAAVHGGGVGPMMMHGGAGIGRAVTAPMVNGRDRGWNGNNVSRNSFAWARSHNHFHDHFHHHRSFAYGFGGPYYDSGYDSCWTYDGPQWVYVCGDYPY
jgi:hypothetical protein